MRAAGQGGPISQVPRRILCPSSGNPAAPGATVDDEAAKWPGSRAACLIGGRGIALRAVESESARSGRVLCFLAGVAHFLRAEKCAIKRGRPVELPPSPGSGANERPPESARRSNKRSKQPDAHGKRGRQSSGMRSTCATHSTASRRAPFSPVITATSANPFGDDELLSRPSGSLPLRSARHATR